jgi:hypothetical protein
MRTSSAIGIIIFRGRTADATVTIRGRTSELILVPVHAALRWRWLVGVARRFAAWRPGRSR